MHAIAFIVNGKIAHREKIVRQITHTFGTPPAVKIFTTEQTGHATHLAAQAVVEGYTHLISVGGDGSLNETANGLMATQRTCSKEQWEKLRLGVLPMGTGNDFIKTIRAPAEPEGLKEMIEQDSFRTIDLGKVNFLSRTQEPQSRYFINITDIGMGGVVVEKLSRYTKWMGAAATYQRAILGTLLTYKNKLVKATADRFTFEGNIMNFILAKGNYFGSGLGIAPYAQPDNGSFSIVILGDISLFSYAKNLGKVRRCQPINHPELKYLTAKEITLESLSVPLPIDMDGEFIGFTPLSAVVVPAAIKFLCPK